MGSASTLTACCMTMALLLPVPALVSSVTIGVLASVVASLSQRMQMRSLSGTAPAAESLCRLLRPSRSRIVGHRRLSPS